MESKKRFAFSNNVSRYKNSKFIKFWRFLLRFIRKNQVFKTIQRSILDFRTIKLGFILD